MAPTTDHRLQAGHVPFMAPRERPPFVAPRERPTNPEFELDPLWLLTCTPREPATDYCSSFELTVADQYGCGAVPSVVHKSQATLAS
jgi:hypothetical protein